MALRINAENFEEKVLKADKPVLVDFYSDSCIPCKQMAGILGDIEDENEDDIYIYKVNVSPDSDLLRKWRSKRKDCRAERTGRNRRVV